MAIDVRMFWGPNLEALLGKQRCETPRRAWEPAALSGAYITEGPTLLGIWRDGKNARCLAHNPEVAGSNPVPATS